jgi:magnesium-transporting ATPase (P-type)
MKWLDSLHQKVKDANQQDFASPISGEMLQLIIGALAALLPVSMIISAGFFSDCNTVQPSISAYYHTGARDLFVGILCAVGVAMFAYKGYSKYDNFFATIAAVAAICVALFPTSVCDPMGVCIIDVIDTEWKNVIHLIAAVTLFMVLAIFCIFLFTITDKDASAGRLMRNKIYYGCGIVILLSIIIIAISMNVEGFPQHILGFPVVFLFETVALVAFSLSWLTKSEKF